jgi:hypothetical protein
MLTPEFKHPVNFWQVFGVAAVEAIVLAVGTMVLGPAIAAALSAVSSTFTTIVTASVTAALADMAGQEVEMAFGMKDRFSWGEVGGTALTAGATAGIGEGIDNLPFGKTTAAVMLKAGIQSTNQQLGQMAFGAQHKFNVTQVAMAIASAGVSQTKVIGFPASSLINALALPLIEGKSVRLDLIAAQALGTMAGNVAGAEIGDVVNREIENRQKQTAPRPASSVPTQLGKTNADNRQRLSDMNAKNRQASGNKPTSKYQAKPSRDWTGLEEKAAAYLYEMVERDLNPITDEEQVAQYYRNHPANQNKNNSSYLELAGVFGKHFVESTIDGVIGPIKALASDPVGTLYQMDMGINYAATHLGETASGIGNAVANDWDILKYGNSQARAALLGDLAGDIASFWLPGVAVKGLGVLGAAGAVGKKSTILKNGIHHLDPKDIRFSQPTVSPNFKNGKSVSDLINDLRSGKISPYDLPPIQVVQRGGKLFSIDNRRLLAFNIAGIEKIPVEIVSLSDPFISQIFGERFNPILGLGKIVVVVRAADREAELANLAERNMIKLK